MNIIKSIFIALFPLFATLVAIQSSVNLSDNGFSIQPLATLISAGGIVAFFALLFVISQARTSKNLTIYTAIIVMGLVVNIVVFCFDESSKSDDLILNLGLVIGWVAYLKWYSVFANRTDSILKLDSEMPLFEVSKSDGELISSASFKGFPAIYLFFRGNWCPLCMAQIKEIAAQYKELEKRSVQMNFISPQPEKFSAKLAKKYDLGFNFLVDAENKVAKQLGIISENGIPAGFQALGYDSDTVMPTVVITDKTGKIVFVDLTDNYRVRPEPKTFLQVLDKL